MVGLTRFPTTLAWRYARMQLCEEGPTRFPRAAPLTWRLRREHNGAMVGPYSIPGGSTTKDLRPMGGGPVFVVELPGIEPGSYGAEPGLLRV